MISAARCFFQTIVVAMAASAVTGCDTIDDHRLPPVAVNVPFTTEAMWHTYGVGGALQYRRFIKNGTECIPYNFPYTVSMYTGYGGILLVGDIYGTPVAYDLSCPVEASPTIRVLVDEDAAIAVCPACGSAYDIFAGQGRPLAGPAADRGYGLERYRVLEMPYSSYKAIAR